MKKYISLRKLSPILPTLIIGALIISFSSFTKSGFLRQYALLHAPQTVKKDATFYRALAIEAEKRLRIRVRYDGSYRKIDYPMGDVPADIGVCSDLIIRSYRALGIDLQERVHRDMQSNFISYPKIWRLWAPDTNIDHRRVPNLMTLFNRAGRSLPISADPRDYTPGDIVAWDLGGAVTHIGIVSTQTSAESGDPLIVHNIGAGAAMDDMLFDYEIIGHYRY